MTATLVNNLSRDSTISCIVCKKELANWTYDSSDGQEAIEVHPMGGLHFLTHGNYGSSIFDPMTTPAKLDVAICDGCIMENLAHVRGSGKQELEDNYDMYKRAANS